MRSSRCTSSVQRPTCDCRLSTAAWRCGPQAASCGGLGLGLGAHGGDLVAGGLDLGVERLGAPLGLLDRGELRRDLVAQGAHPRDQRRVGLLDPAQVLGPGLQVVEAVGLEQDRGRVGHPAAVDRDQAVGERVQPAAELRSRGGELVAGQRDLGLERGARARGPARARR